MASSSKTSEAIRKEGAKYYADAFINKDLAPLIRIERAKKAIGTFMDARKAASTEGSGQDWVYATKNYGMASWKLASTKELSMRLGEDAVFFYFKEAFVFLIEALLNGKLVHLPKEWYVTSETYLLRVVDSVVEYLIDQSNDWRYRCSKISMFLPLTETSCITTAYIHMKMAREMLKYAIYCTDSDLMNDAFSALHEMHQPISFSKQYLERTKKSSWPSELVEELEDIEHSQRRYLCRVTSAKERILAEELQVELMFGDDELNMDLAMIVLDRYVAAKLASKSAIDNEACLESEARASVGIGIFHYSILKNEERGHQHLLHAIQLVDILTHAGGGTFFNCTWYQRAKTLIEEYRERRLAFDQAEIAAQREPMLLKLKPKLDAMRACMDKSTGKSYKFCDFVKYVYENHPPANGKCLSSTLDKDDDASLKKICLKAITDYHPDKKHNKDKGMEWYILCEEILKEFNAFYEYFKCM